jgi:predicted DNA-binding protein
MEEILGYKEQKELKVKIQYCRMDDSMISRLKEIRRKTGISTSEIIRESVRRLLLEIEETGGFTLKM